MSRPTFNLGAFLEKENLKIDGFKLHHLLSHFEDHPRPYKMGYVLDASIGDAPSGDASMLEVMIG
jgi:hypothetical protein